MKSNLTWTIYKQPRPYGPKHIGWLGCIPVALVTDRNERDPRKDRNFSLEFSLPPKDWRGSDLDLFLTGFHSEFFKLEKAKAAAERIVRKWVDDAKLRPMR